MDFHHALSNLTNNLSFKEWHKNNPDSFLAHGFMMLDDANKDVWQIGFYKPERSKITTFIVNKTIEHTSEQEVLESGNPIQKLSVEDVKIPHEGALKTAKDIMQKEFKKEVSIKEFFIIQKLEDRTVFNITFFTQSFKTVNVKIDAKTGEIVSKSLQSLMEFG